MGETVADVSVKPDAIAQFLPRMPVGAKKPRNVSKAPSDLSPDAAATMSRTVCISGESLFPFLLGGQSYAAASRCNQAAVDNGVMAAEL